jgi:hypothetical protein
MYSAILADRLDEAKDAYDEAKARGFDTVPMHRLRVRLALLQNDDDAMQEQWSWAIGKPVADQQMLYYRAEVERFYGHYRVARHFSAQATDFAAKESALQDVSFDADEDALQEAEVGNSARARQIAEKALKSVQQRDTQLILALAFARAGDIARAQTIADMVSQETPLDTLVQNYCLPTIRAAIKLHANNHAAVIEILRPAVKYDLAALPNFDTLYAAYIRGLAYLQAGEGSLAEAEFQNVLAHPGLLGVGEIGPLSRLQLARAQKIAGKDAEARKSYEDFLTLWKSADPDLPILKEAKSEYAKLQ